ncbi:Signal transduction histidine kinase [Bifidobacterium lemurum]|uniref:histidine kinase n=1 Tax=Bifidobacterium lemurum TaxID=1603886 RepID=A0A261FLY9_9BIFI|nr:HAMP domain-containing sensor histidine kinase [Bifidobacterium lemurum]OZG60200.1 Signal transduction histidine kinase [Bifidobacterium lemurum]QOL34099.1 HAMP domain-containing histidine kinase [Bifidobacterium lemurum]
MNARPTVKERRYSPWVFVWTFLILCALAGGQALILAEYARIDKLPLPFILGMTGYWVIVAAVMSVVTYRQIRRRVKPMEEFAEASRQVAAGDFSVWLEPRHLEGSRQWDSIDQMYADFNTMVEELGSVEMLKDDFVSNVSHEIKTPLSVIQSYAALLERPDLSEEQRIEYAHTVVVASKRLSTLVSNVLRLSRMEAAGAHAQVDDYDLARQLADVALGMGDLFDAKGIEFDVDIEDRVLAHADAGMMEIVWSNVLSNALKFTPSGGRVSLTQTSDERSATVTVDDTGCGMTASEAMHAFDKFYQGDTSHASEGNGLGLAMTKRAVELCGGDIAIASEPGRGTTVTVRVPVAR